MALQFRRGTSSDRSDVSFIPELAEPIYETDTNKLYIGDGATAGGNLVGGVTKLEDVGDVTLSSEEVFTPNFYSITSEVVTFLFPTSHTITTGTQITVSSSSVASLDGTYTATFVDSNTITVPKTGASDISSTALTANISKVVATNSAIRWNNTSSIWEDYLPDLDSLSNVDLTTNAPVTGDVLSFDGTNFVPGLSGNLDLEGNYIVSSSNGDIEFEPNGTGKVKIRGNATGGSGQIVLNCEQNTHGIILKGPPHSAAASYTLTLPNTIGTSGQVLSTDGTDTASWITPVTALNDLSDVTAPSPSDGQALIYSSASSAWIPDTAGTTVQHTQFILDSPYTPYTTGAQPTGTVANSTTVGQNNGTWYEATAANYSTILTGPSASTYNPNLSGISFDTSNYYFTVPQGRYYITATIVYVLGNYSAQGSTAYPRDYSSSLIAYDPSFNFNYADSGRTPRSTFASRDSLETLMKHDMTVMCVMEDSTATNNLVQLLGVDDAQPGLYILSSDIRFIRLGDV